MTPLSAKKMICPPEDASDIGSRGVDLLSVALWMGGAVCHQEVYAVRHGQAAYIVTLVERLMRAADITYSQLTHIAAGRGPGSFTGARVALAAAKGFV